LECFYNGVRIAPKSMNSGEMMQRTASSKPSSSPFSTLLGMSDGGNTSMRPVGAFASHSDEEFDTGARNQNWNQQKKPQATATQASADAIATASTQLIDLTSCTPLASNANMPGEAFQDSDVFGDASAGTVASADNSGNSEVTDPESTAKISQLTNQASPAAEIQEQVSGSIPTGQFGFDRAKSSANGADEGIAEREAPSSRRAQAEAQPDSTTVQNDGACGTSSIPDSRVAAQISAAFESLVAESQESSSNLNPVQNASKVSRQVAKQGASSSANLDLTTSKDQAKTGAESASSPSRANQSSHVPTQHNQVDIAQSTPLTTKGPDGSALPANFLNPRTPGLDSSSSAGTSVRTGGDLRHSEDGGVLPQNQFDGAAITGSGGVNAAHLIQTMSESEMRLGMHSLEFGDISIRTSVSQQQLVAQITVDHRDLGTAISSHIPLTQTKLGNDYGIRASIEVNQSGLSFSGDRQGSQQQAQRQSAASPQRPGGSVESETSGTASIPAQALDAAYRLDIRA
jgi:hypothetical protein